MATHITKTVAWNNTNVYKYKITLDAYFELVNLVGTTATINISGNYIVDQSEHDQEMVLTGASDFGFLFEGNVTPAAPTTVIPGNFYMASLPTLFGGSAEQYSSLMLLEFRGDTYATDGGNFTNLWTKSDGLIINRKFGNTSTTVPLNINVTVDVSSGGIAPVLSWATTYVTFEPTTYHWGDSVAWVTWVDLNWDATLNYNANGGAGGPGTATHSTPASDNSWTFTIPNTPPTRPGYEFQGWADSSSATTATYHSGDTITVTKDNPTKTIYAVWKIIYNYSLTYDANGGTGAPATQTYSTTATSHNFTVASGTPTWGRYKFLGWSRTRYTDSRTSADVEYVAGDTFTVQSSNPSRTLYAVWMMDYRPGATLDTTTSIWKSHNRTNGACHVLSNTGNMTWQECRSIGGAEGEKGNPPLILTAPNANSWRNQKLLGKE